MTKVSIVVLGGLGLLGFACGTERLYVGSNGDAGTGLGNSADAGDSKGVRWPGTPSNSFELPCTLPAPDWIAGTWQGELDTYALPSGSRAIRIEVTGAFETADGLCGKVTFGSAAPPPLATDPAAAPPGAPPLDVAAAPIEGVPYEFYAAGLSEWGDAGLQAVPRGFAPAVEGQRVRFGITLRQSFKSWCNLQLAYKEPLSLRGLNPSAQYGCTPPEALSPAPGGVYCGNDGIVTGLTVHDASCAQVEFCLFGLCDCDGTGLSGLAGSPTDGCTILDRAATRFDLTLAGGTLSGGFALGQSVETMHLRHVP